MSFVHLKEYIVNKDINLFTICSYCKQKQTKYLSYSFENTIFGI